MKTKQKDIAQQAKISPTFLCLVLSGQRRPSWKTAKRLASATSTPPVLWMEGSPEQLKAAINRTKPEIKLIGT